MRVLLTADPELPVPPQLYGGIERIIDELVRGLKGRGHVVGLIAHPESSSPADELFPWPGRQSQRWRDSFENSLTLRRAVRAFQPDVLHSFSRLLYAFSLLPSPLPKVMSYQRCPSLQTTAYARRLARGTLTFTGCSEHIAAIGRAAGGRWVAIPNFVDTERYTFQSSVPDDAPLVFLSRVEAIKGAHTAIEIARRSGRRLLIAGNRVDSSEGLNYWRERIEPFLGQDGVEYVGPVDDVAKNRLLGGAAAMVVPIEWDEPFGIVFAEALACGTPVITCPRGAAPEIIEEGRQGFLVRTAEEGVRAVARIDEIDRQSCRQRAEAMFSSARVLDRYEALYRQVRVIGEASTSISPASQVAS